MRRSLRWLPIALCLLIAPSAITAQTPLPNGSSGGERTVEAKVSESLRDRLVENDTPRSVLVILTDQFDLQEYLTASGVVGSRADRVAAAYLALTDHAVTTQGDLRAWLDAQGVPYRAYYVANMIHIDADSALVDELAMRDDVAQIVDNPRIYQTHGADARTLIDGWQVALGVAQSMTHAAPLLPYGLSATKAVAVWELGYTGRGIVIASQDTGVDWQHPALQGPYRGWHSWSGTAEHRYNWFDAWGTSGRPLRCDDDAQIPCDDEGHGTHTVGTMLGIATDIHPRVGMAPNAEWIGCRNMDRGFGTPASYAACFEFFMAPYPQDGDPFLDGRPDLAPHIINNSWGCPPSEGCDPDTLTQVVNNIRAAGIFVVSSAGNDGFFGCQSMVDPIAIYDASLTVGAHSASGAIAPFSSRGPVAVDNSGRAKPDITAPGVAVESTYLDNGYQVLQGTSMASPHVAGAIALLWSAAPDLIRDIEQTEQIILKSATPAPTHLCTGDEAVAVVPNNIFGYGRLNALAAVQMALHPMALTLSVVVDNSPQADATVRLVDELTGWTRTATTSSTGVVQLDRVYSGNYQVEVDVAGKTMDVGMLSLEQEVANQAGQVSGEDVTVQYTATLIESVESRRVLIPLVSPP